MPAEADDSVARERRVNQVIADYLQAVDAGSAPDRHAFLREHDDISEELASFFADQDSFLHLATPLRTAGEPEPIGAAWRNDLAEDDPSPPVVATFGNYELQEEIARGGMGVVYKARQISLNRVVALKMILAGHLASPRDVRRFRAEAEAAGQLDHPGIVPVYEVGEQNGQHYFSMGYVEGESLAARLRESRLSWEATATLLRLVCQAVQYAHEHGVIHRDLKPANILLEGSSVGNSDSSGQSSPIDSDLRPRITDFGLAKRLQAEVSLTGTGQILGTPSYMSPEQASGGALQAGPPTDVFSLGAILYRMLAGRPPFQGETPLETLSQLLDSDPLPPRLINPDVPRDLEAICVKCLCKDPARRYPSARALGDELGRFLRGEPIHASGVNLLDRVTSALRSSRNEEQFRGWGLGLMAFGLVVLLSHVAIFALEQIGRGFWGTYFATRSVMFAAFLVMFCRFRRHSLLPTQSAEKLVWVVWSGYLVALGATNLARLVLGHDQRESYASFAILAGFGFLIMGGHVWEGGYIVGVLFMLAAPLLACYTDAAPLVFGMLWTGALFTFGVHYWRRGRRGAAHHPQPPDAHSLPQRDPIGF